MTTKTKTRPVATLPDDDLLATSWTTPPLTTEDFLARIQTLGQRVNSYVRFMSQISKLTGTSAEAKKRAVALFYERLVSMERQLGKIQEELQLG
jgi:hypothetical protein